MLALMIKSFLLVSLAILYRSALPRYRIDQLLTINWKSILFYLLGYYMYLVLLMILFM